ncbi:MAG: glutathione S-transferase N-terminal domain-containing protein [Myxococcales bacterium]|nr:glutathione S-transferase N-terminal domain-containing protein [Myxococcales bacterium]
MTQTPKLALYLFEGCPYCERVRAAVRDLQLQVEERDVRRDAAHATDLQAATGRGTVPVLRIEEGSDTRWLPESADIVDHLYVTYGEGRSPTLLATRTIPQVAVGIAMALAVTAYFTEPPVRGWLLVVAVMIWALRDRWALVGRWIPGT